MRIGIDIDDTLTNTQELLLTYAQKYDYEELNRETTIDRDKLYMTMCGSKLGIGMNWTEEETDTFKKKYHGEVLENAPIKAFAKEMIDKLIRDGHQIIFITARNNDGDLIDDSYRISKNLLDKNNIKYHKLLTECTDKSVVCKEENIDIFIDDKIETCLKVANLGIKTFIMNTPLNNRIDENQLTRVYSWVDIYYKIKKEVNNAN